MKKYLIILSGFILIFNSCVPKRNLLSEQKRVKELQKDSSSTHSSLTDCNSQVATLQKDKADLQNSVNDLSASYQSSSMTVTQQAKRLRDLEGLIQAQKDVMNKLKENSCRCFNQL
jgi:septal ring factor EnvC (AmiA/AmiB activator)